MASDDDYIQHLIDQQQRELDELALLSPESKGRTVPLAYTPWSPEDQAKQQRAPATGQRQSSDDAGDNETEEDRIRAWQEEWVTREAERVQCTEPAMSPRRPVETSPQLPTQQLPPPPAPATLAGVRFGADGGHARYRDSEAVLGVTTGQGAAQGCAQGPSAAELLTSLAEEQSKRRRVLFAF